MQTDRQYPVGKFQRPAQFEKGALEEQIRIIASFPADLKNVVAGMTDAQLNTPYREGGWTVKQVVHHCADSHMNSFIRFKLGLTEENPAIKPYAEAAWAEGKDYSADISTSLQIIEGVHARWTILLQSMQESDYMKTVFHPQHKRDIPLYELLALYVWHSKHHLGHVQLVR